MTLRKFAIALAVAAAAWVFLAIWMPYIMYQFAGSSTAAWAFFFLAIANAIVLAIGSAILLDIGVSKEA